MRVCVAQGLFNIPQLVNANGFKELQQEAETRTAQLINEATDVNRTRKLVTVFDELSDTLCRVADMV